MPETEGVRSAARMLRYSERAARHTFSTSRSSSMAVPQARTKATTMLLLGRSVRADRA
jgi:hypothetical protein